jgi:ABC-type multidrug transport system fused ATPase/permease subunit
MASPPQPPDRASWLSQFFFLFVSPVLDVGVRKGGLTQDDLPLLSACDHPGRLVHDFLTLGGGRATMAGGSLFRRILRLYTVRYTLSGLFLLATNVSALAVPIVMSELLTHLAASPAVADSWYGYALALALAAACAGQALVIHQFWFQAAVVSIHSEVILTTLVYVKSLSVSDTGRAELGLTRGKLINHMAVDACRLNETWVFPFLHWNTWSAAFTVSVAIAYLYSLLGTPGLLGCAVMLIFVPLSTLANRAAKRFSEAIQKKRDARGSLIAEAVAGIATIKAYGWTEWFGERIATARDAEMMYMRRKQYLGVVGDFIGILAPLAVMATTFSLFAVMRPGVPLTAAVAFSSMSWFDQLRQPLRSIPNTITTFVDASVSLHRLASLLNAQDTDLSGLQAWVRAMRPRLEAPPEDGSTPSAQSPLPMADWLSPSALLRGLDLGQGTTPEQAPSGEAGASERLLGLEEEEGWQFEEETSVQGSPADEGPAIELQGASFAWDAQATTDASPTSRGEVPAVERAVMTVLRDITLTCPRGSMTLVLGPVGCGKSSLLSGLICEARRTGGTALTRGSVAYASQLPWVLNRSLRDNITFVDDFKPEWYATVVHACALDVDVESLRYGHDTLVGDAGVTLSGGQKQRLALARALYADKQVYILDDVLSAVDAAVGAHIWETALVGLLVGRGKTVVLATHAVQYARRPEVSQVVVLAGGGHLLACGPYAAVLADPACASVFASVVSPTSPAESPDVVSPMEVQAVGKLPSAGAVDNTGAETYAQGTIAAAAMARFVRSMGSPPFIATLVGLYVVTQALVVSATWWMAKWVSAAEAGADAGRVTYFSSVYAAINGGIGVTSLLRMLILATGTMRAGTALHNGAIKGVLGAPASFFSTNPAGRISNRFIADVATIDSAVRYSISAFAQQVFSAIGIVAVLAATTPYVLLWVAALSIVYYRLAQRYRISARDMRRLQSTAKSPILSHYAETLRGVATIRAFGPRASTAFVRRHLEVSAVHLRAWLAYWAANEYISCWLEVVGCLVILVAAVLAVYEHGRGNLATGDVGLQLTYNMQIPAVLMWLVRAFSLVETDAVAIERIAEYCTLESEEAQAARRREEQGEGGTPTPVAEEPGVLPASTPALELGGVRMRYSETAGAPEVLQSLSLCLPPGAKCAVVGRTGAGKSSILQALLRMYPTEAGSIRVGGVELGRLSCKEARTHVTALLQDGWLFAGSVRDNLLGPLAADSAAPDAALLQALSDVGLAGGPGTGVSLHDPVTDGGGNFSSGEHALLSLARAIVRLRSKERDAVGAKLLVCDEPTAHVDASCDALVHAVLLARPEAVVCVCHRLVHVPRFDVVAVVEGGRVTEVGPPAELAAAAGSAYRRLLWKGAV